MKFERASGVLLHPTSLPGPYGIGDLGSAAYRFVDWLSVAGCKLWQMLPLGPTGYGDSPYQSFSTFAGNPYLINPEQLLREGWLHPDDLIEDIRFPDDHVDFGRLIPWKLNLLERAFIRFKSHPGVARADFDHFCAENASWLPDYALFMAIKESNGGGDWGGWPQALRKRDSAALAEATQRHADAVERFKFYQFVFFRQWNAIKKYSSERNIRIIGDIPIYVSYDSADVWAHPELFTLDEDRRPTFVAGVPPDYFSLTGQLWGNPLYRWDVLKDTDYSWWLERLRATLRVVDIARLDHFRGFAGYWEIPAGNLTAETGRWVTGPGANFFEAVKTSLSEADGSDETLPIIAEDLGVITPDVVSLREEFGLPGMKVLQFAFSGPDNPFLPHNYLTRCVAYTGTHDNDTSRGWFESAPEHERDFARRYLAIRPCEGSNASQGFVWDLIRAAWSSVAAFAIAPMQDLLNLGSEARMNYPGQVGGNWTWRMRESALTDDLANRLQALNHLYLR